VRDERSAAWLALPGAIFLAACSEPGTPESLGSVSSALTATVPPSSGCHKTDGLFSTCADGTQEWQNVPFVSFPERASYVYATQADLDPTRSSPGSPVDTLMLMYDECGRTTPMGINEYFQVSFTSVGSDDAGDYLKHYLVHIFPDGTIRFIEDGVPHGPDRAPRIYSQRGAARFGQSPNCPFDHVVVEYQIALDAAGGNGYSSDPLWWGGGFPVPGGGSGSGGPGGGGAQEICGDGIDNDSDGVVDETCPEVCGDDIDNDSNGEVDETCPPGPRIKDVAVAGGPVGAIQMGDRYRIKTKIVENAQNPDPVFAFVEVTETIAGQTAPFGDCAAGPGCPNSAVPLLFPSTSASASIVPLVPHNFFNPSLAGIAFDYQHAWHWAEKVEVGCWTLTRALGVGTGVDAGIHQIFHHAAGAWASTAWTLWEASHHISHRLHAEALLVREGRYNYGVTANDLHGSNTSDLDGIAVVVPQYKQDAMTRYFQAALLATTATGLGTSMSLNPATFTPGATLLVLGALAALDACSSYDIAVDPDPNYQELATFVPLDLPGFEALPPSPEKQLAELWRNIVSHQRALARTLGRFEGARAAGDAEFMTIQLDAAADFQEGIRTLLASMPQTVDLAVASLEQHSVILDEQARSVARDQLLTNGLSPLQQEILTSAGVSQVDMQNLAGGLAGLLSYPPPSWQSALRQGTAATSKSASATGRYINHQSGVLGAAFASPVRAGFNAESLPPNDDDSSAAIQLDFPLNFFGEEHTELYVNNNGNLTLSAPLGEFVQLQLGDIDVPMIAPFYANIDTSAAGLVSFGEGAVNGRRAFGATWVGVRGASLRGDVSANHFQVVLVDRSDVTSGDFDVEFNFESVEWDAIDGGEGGLVRVGYTDGRGEGGSFFELPGSAQVDAFRDSNRFSGLVHDSLDSSRLGRYVFEIRSGQVLPAKRDSDRDGVLDELDNCITTPNNDQRDSNLDRIGDVCTAPDSFHTTSLFIQAHPDGSTLVWDTPSLVADQPGLAERLALVVSYRLETGLTTDARMLIDDLVGGLVANRVISPGDAGELVSAVLAMIGGETNQAPVARCQDMTLPAGLACAAAASIDAGSSDPDGDAIACTQSPPGPYPLGKTPVTLTCVDGSNASASCSAEIDVIDEQPPQVTVGESLELWPPNHKLVTVELDECDVQIHDQCQGALDALQAHITCVTSDELEDGPGDGNTVGDIVIVDAGTVRLRAERSGNLDGRVYTIHFEVSDAAGNAGRAQCRVGVPHNQGNAGDAVDSGVSYQVGSCSGSAD
jgi:hypothetical protein